jgi:N-acetylmuramoyl-L-alanine amidase
MSVIGLCIGHSRRGDSGATNTRGVSEHRFNSAVGSMTREILQDSGYKVHLVSQYEGNGYTSAMGWVSGHLAKLGVTVAAELHFNSAGPTANGHEWLYWHRSPRGQKLASFFNQSFKEAFPDARVRGIKSRDHTDRGSLFLRLTRCPAVILEPFFGSNPEETEYYSDRMPALALAYAKALMNYST